MSDHEVLNAMRSLGAKVSGPEILGFKGGWASIPFAGGHMRSHYWTEVTDLLEPRIGPRGRVRFWNSACNRAFGGTDSGIRPLHEGDADRCKVCEQRRKKAPNAK